MFRLKTFLCVLCPALLVLLFAQEVNSDDLFSDETTNLSLFAGGAGTESDPFQITNWFELDRIRHNPGQSFILMNDLDSTTNGYDDLVGRDNGWLPLGTNDTAFTGSFDGRGYAIRDLRITLSESGAGLFGIVENGVIRNVGLEDVDINGQATVGGLIGSAHPATIENTYTTGSVNGISGVGGLVGVSIGATIRNSYSGSAVTGTGSTIGGLVGISANGSTIKDGSYSTGEVTGSRHVGGLVGTNIETIIENSHSHSNVTAERVFGGLIGYNFSGSIRNCYSYGDVNGIEDSDSTTGVAGGLIGSNISSDVIECYSISKVKADSIVGGLVGQNATQSNIVNSYSSNNTVTGYTVVGGLVGINRDSNIEESYSENEVTADSIVGGLVGENDYSSNVNNSSNSSVIGSVSVGGLVGAAHFGTTLENSFATGEVSGDSVIGGLVGVVHHGVTIENSYTTGEVNGGARVGGLVGFAHHYATIENSYTTGTVKGTSSVGGLVGVSSGTTIINSYSESAVSGDSTDIGGLVGFSENGSTIKDSSFSTGEVNGSRNVGGLVGNNLQSTIENSYSHSIVTAESVFGGLVGLNQSSSTIRNCYSTGEVNGIEDSDSTTTVAGGLVGRNDTSDIIECYSESNVTADNIVGGLVGENAIQSNIVNSFSSSSVIGSTSVGGLVGVALEASVIENSYATGEVSGELDIGGLVGVAHHGATIENSYTTGTVNGISYVGGLVGVSIGTTIRTSYSESAVSGTGEDIGGLVGFSGNGSTIEDSSYSTGEVTGSQHVGGLVGNNVSSTIVNSHSRSAVTAQTVFGGLVGLNQNSSTISKCYSTGRVVGIRDGRSFSTVAGGLVGENNGSVIEESYSENEISADSVVGGLVGRNNSSATIKRSYSESEIIANATVGGLVGINNSSTLEECYSVGTITGQYVVGGLVGASNGGSRIKKSFSNVSVEIHEEGNTVGGLVGINNTNSIVQNCYSKGDIEGQDIVGGLVGLNRGSVENSYSRGSVRGTNNIGGLIGQIGEDGSVENSFWDTETSELDTSAAGEGKTSEQMKIASTFLDAGWDFMGETDNGNDEIWGINTIDNCEYPFLKWQGYKLEQTITFIEPLPDTVTYGDAPFPIEVETSSGGTVTFASSEESVATVSEEGEITIVSVGEATLTVSVDSDETYYPAQVSADLIVLEKPVTITINEVEDKEYDGTDEATIKTFTIDGVLDDDHVVIDTGRGAFECKNAGTDKTVTFSEFSLSGDDAGNYRLEAQPEPVTANITEKEVTIVSVTVEDKEYDGTHEAIIISGIVDEVISGDDVSVAQTTGVFEDKNVGDDKPVTGFDLSLTGHDAGNYRIGSSPSTVTGNIVAREITVVGIAADSRVYDGTVDLTLTWDSLGNVVFEDDVAIEAIDGSFADKNAEENKIVVISSITLTGDDAINYAYELPDTILSTISKRPINVTSVTIADKAYDGTTDATIDGVTYEDGFLILGDTLSLSPGIASFEDKNAGSDINVTLSEFLLTGADANNYFIELPSVITGNITKKRLTVTAEDTSKYINTDDPSFTLMFEGFISGENKSALIDYGAEREEGEAAGTYEIVPFAEAQNYRIIPVNGVFTIHKPTSVTRFNSDSSPDDFGGIMIYNNPVALYSGRAQFIINAPAAADFAVVIYDALGNVIHKADVKTDREGRTAPVMWNLTNRRGAQVSPGSYLIQAQGYDRRTGEVYRYRAMLGVAR
ncbi:GLUG motif-containing protein [Chitinispirillales bacterium ANBcel5]|uniref:GLUG motif-containing protein n=1 Tax=Cellulosispirillum alkaliphilum TaxID=3039283 RepID=UPI002A50FF18|nr:GLUG motif-containing protein [Chitinispirillales bacterium ANBcel5]